MPDRRSVVWMLAAILAACSSTPRLTTAPSAPVDLAGRWELDREASDDPRAAIRDALIAAKSEDLARGMRSPGGADGGGPPAGPVPKAGGMGSAAAGAGNPGGMVLNTDWIEIKQSAEQVTVNFVGQRARRYPLRTPITTINAAGTMETESGWLGTEFWTITKGERGMKLTERFVVSADGATLSLETVLKAKVFKDPVTIRRVYHRAA